MKWIVEELVTATDEYGKPEAVGWKTDSTSSRYWAGRRWQEMQEQGRVARLVGVDGRVFSFN